MRAFNSLPDAIAWSKLWPCLWAYVDGKPYPVWWRIISRKRDLHVVCNLWSAAGPVANLKAIAWSSVECPEDTKNILGDFAYGSEEHFYRPKSLIDFQYKDIPIRYRHVYEDISKKPKDKSQGTLF